jgi:hypothetical protein
MFAFRAIIAAATLAVAASIGAAANAGTPKPPIKPLHPFPLCLAHNETDFIEGVGKVLYFIDARCHKHFVRFIIS